MAAESPHQALCAELILATFFSRLLAGMGRKLPRGFYLCAAPRRGGRPLNSGGRPTGYAAAS
jgi:hypothetical protein